MLPHVFISLAAICSGVQAPLPVVLQRGQGAWLWDTDGRRYLDMHSAYSAVSLGHAHPRILKVLAEQAQRLSVTSRAFYTDRLGPFVEELSRLAPVPLMCYPNAGLPNAFGGFDETPERMAADPGLRDRFLKGIPAGRLGKPLA